MGRAFAGIATAMSLILIFGSWSPIAGLIAGLMIAGTLAALTIIGNRRLRAALNRQILDRCEKQHAALMRGNEDYGIYGMYRPSTIEFNDYDGIEFETMLSSKRLVAPDAEQAVQTGIKLAQNAIQYGGIR